MQFEIIKYLEYKNNSLVFALTLCNLVVGPFYSHKCLP